ncbi:glutamine--fructose-6-phosphate transaminase (isomerizing) [Lachnoclostridium sp. An169]|uniref:glutamine--fructose-6-phosphate transaminase (isomerizing) n=1 Tax=Lachnoclostridium sp. An169 TaxID=1965569 RepID=UPI000B3A427D|nr:glutamine--fructose-6-phosphate transaminase (isomerizing) [Lachnoclostridium sp. An169]OUP86227.1 glutamine--fructose-6-phosphate transaminase (isomerizing) [Lachnoclostridium sp. An169]
MCGIVGYVGEEPAAPILLKGLEKLEYRGYDSAGIAVRNEETGKIEIVKAKGRLKILSEKTDGGAAVPGTCGIGHTRWATHGEPSETNAHPHCTDDRSVVLVHNGIIENYQELKEKLQKSGYTFYSQTDTEIAVKLVDYYYKKTGSPLEALTRSMLRIRGSYAFGVMFHDYPGKLYAARKDSPLIIGKSKTGCLIASDVPAILDRTRNVYYIGNLEIAELSRDEIHFYNLDREEIEKEVVKIKWDAESAEKGGYEHFMLKEIHEQPRAVQDTVGAYVKEGRISFGESGLTDEVLKGLDRIYIVACGSAYHVGMVGKYVLEDLADIPVEVDLASEFRYRNPKLVPNSMVIIVSQSGETADSLAALRLTKERGIPVLGIVNVLGSSIARESDYIMYTYAGPEISVATTKAYSAQLIAVYLLAIQMAFVKGLIDEKRYGELLAELGRLPEKIQKTLDDKDRIQWFASKYANAKDIFFIGRGIDYAISLEGSLKMKEISYIHSEAYAAGELKHGTISLIEDGTLVVGVVTQKALFEKTISNMVEVKSRGAYLMGLTLYGNYNIEDTADFSVYVPKTEQYFTTSLAIIPLQLMGYYVSVAKGLDVDKPRNLAKSVTVE